MHSKCLGYWAYLVDDKCMGSALIIGPTLGVNRCIVNVLVFEPTCVKQKHERS